MEKQQRRAFRKPPVDARRQQGAAGSAPEMQAKNLPGNARYSVLKMADWQFGWQRG